MVTLTRRGWYTMSGVSNLDGKWGKKYPVVIESWQNNWEELSQYFQYTEPIRRIIYTTNAVEGFHRQVRKVTKTKGAFPNDMALLKLVYLATMNIGKKWTSPLQNWSLTVQQLYIKFGERIPLDLAAAPSGGTPRRGGKKDRV
ncbi:MAG: transposase [Sediminicola sp.]